jgi:general nucleoside transport system permease protein
MIALAFFAAVLRISVPYALGALGGVWSERAGVIDIGLEGMLLGGAFAATAGAFFTHSAAGGLASGMAGGAALAALYALLVLRFRGDQIVCGVALNLFADGATRFLLKALFGSSSNSPVVAAWGQLAVPVVIATVVLVVLSQWALARTRFGLRVRAVGEHPAAAASLGVSVERVRWLAVLGGGALAGLGGAWLAADQHQFVAGMSNGRGYIALAALIFGGWRPVWALLAGLLFGFAEAAQIALQAAGIGLPAWLVQMMPYILTMLALAGFRRRRVAAPSALGRAL